MNAYQTPVDVYRTADGGQQVRAPGIPGSALTRRVIAHLRCGTASGRLAEYPLREFIVSRLHWLIRGPAVKGIARPLRFVHK